MQLFISCGFIPKILKEEIQQKVLQIFGNFIYYEVFNLSALYFQILYNQWFLLMVSNI